MKKRRLKKAKAFYRKNLITAIGLVSLFIGTAAVLAGEESSLLEIMNPTFWSQSEWLPNLTKAIASQMFGTGIGIIVLSWASDKRVEETEKRALLLQMGSPDSSVAIEAVRKLRIKGWLADGTAAEGNFWRTDLHRTNLSGADLSECNFGSAILDGANLSEANLEATDFSSASLENVSFQSALLKSTQFNWANMQGAKLTGITLNACNMNDADLMKADLSNAVVSEGMFQNTKMQEADLRYARFENVVLDSVDFGQAKLWEVDFSNVQMQHVSLTDAEYTVETKWPKGFDPQTLGAILVDDEGLPVN